MQTKTRNRIIAFGALAATTTAIILTSTTSHKYYFSSSGNDGNDGSIERPFKSIDKMNRLLPYAKGDDYFFLNRGDTFYGTIKIGANGYAGKPLHIEAYGEGNKPVVTGLKSLTNWTSLGDNKYESLVDLTYLRMVTVNGNVTGKGRYPNADAANKGWAIVKSSWAGYIVDAALPSGITISGKAELCTRTERWVTDVYPITKREGSNIFYTRYAYGSSSQGYVAAKGYGYFIQNTPSCLDKNGEWCHNPSTHKITMFSSSGAPTGVQVSAYENLLVTGGKDYITVNNIRFEGSNSDNIFVSGGSQFVTIENCETNNSGRNGILVQYMTSTDFIAVGNKITNSNNIGIEANSEINTRLEKNFIENSGLINGLSGSGEGGMGSGISLRHVTNNFQVRFNTILNSGMCGILFKNDKGKTSSNNVDISYNFIRWFCKVKDDAAGIYGWAGLVDPPVYKNRSIHHNIILDGIGVKEGAADSKGVASVIPSAFGIYGDLGFSDANIFENLIGLCTRAGLYINYGDERLWVYKNTFYQNGFDMGTDSRGCQIFINYSNERIVKNLTIRQNILWASSTQNLIVVTNYNGTYGTNLGSVDSNRFVYDNKKVYQFVWWLSSGQSKLPFKDWRNKGYDRTSDTMTASAITPIKFAYASDSSTTVNLGTGTYIDADRKQYTGEVSISPFKAFVGRKK